VELIAPFILEELLGLWGARAVYFAIGLAFGAVLEMAGFGWSPKLAAQFYFKDLTVLKVMFTAIVVAMVLIFWSTGLQWLDYEQVWVNPTYLWPGIVGGLIMGVGFILGGFCPGTSLVAISTLKVDGMFFGCGLIAGIFAFGETAAIVEPFWNSSFLGRLTLPEVMGLPTGVMVTLIIGMAIFVFWGCGQLEMSIGGKPPGRRPRKRLAGAAALFMAAVGLIFVGQPTTADRWEWVAEKEGPRLEAREVFIHPGELVDLISNDDLRLVILDLREEVDYNVFHIHDAVRAGHDLPEALYEQYRDVPSPTVIVFVDNGEARSIEAWKTFTAMGILNTYILEGGVNGWLDLFGHANHEACPAPDDDKDRFRHRFQAALGDRHPEADPDLKALGLELEYDPKVKLQNAGARRKGGCG
jgi:rhodanese-related sulfurtransferase